MGYEVRMPGAFRIAEEVRGAIQAGAPVVALESSVVAQGLPPPHGVEASRRCAAAVRKAGALPAVVAVIGGQLLVGASEAEVERLAEPGRAVAKAGARDLAALLARGGDAGTTVSATCVAAALAGIRIFATGGIGGVHRAGPGGAWDVSADLGELARSPVCVVSAGPKAILDVPATAEVLETLGVPVVGWGTAELPAFWSASSGVRIGHRADGAGAVARILHQHWNVLRRSGGVLLAVPPPQSLDPADVERAIASAEAEAAALGISGPERTPYLLAAVSRATGGRTLRANLALLEENARVAALVAVALAAGEGT